MQAPVRYEAHHAQTTARRAAANPTLELLERVGYVARGLLYGVMGWLALKLALLKGGSATDLNGSLLAITRSPIGRPLLIALIVGLAAYSIWGLVRAVFDPLHRGSKPAGLAERLGFVWSAFGYAALVVFALHVLAGDGQATAHDATQSSVRTLLSYPAGEWAAVLIGLVTIVGGLSQFWEAYKGRFLRDMKQGEMSPDTAKTVNFLGRMGYFSRGAVFTLVGWFILQAGLNSNPSGAHGYRGAFAFLLAQPYGHLLLAVVALGFIALGLHSIAMARWGRLLGSSY